MNVGIIVLISPFLEPARRAIIGLSGSPVLTRNSSLVSLKASELSMASMSGLPLYTKSTPFFVKYGISNGKTMKSLSTKALSFLTRLSLEAQTFGAM